MGGFIAPIDVLSPPPSPPHTPTESHAGSLRAPSPKVGHATTDLSEAIQSLPIEQDNPLYSIVQLMKSQMLAQAQQQEQLMAQLSDLRTSHADLKAQMADDQDEIGALRERTSLLSMELGEERKRREESEGALCSEKEKVNTLRAKTEESRRAIMRLQDEAASRRNSESRRSSVATVGTAVESGIPSRRASIQVGANSRRKSLISGMDVSSAATEQAARRASCAVIPDGRRSSLICERRASAYATLTGTTAPAPPSAPLPALPIGLGVDLDLLSTSAPTPSGFPPALAAAQAEVTEKQPEPARPALRQMILNNENVEDGGRSRSSLTSMSIDEEGLGQTRQKKPARRKSARQSVDLSSMAYPRRHGSIVDQENTELAQLKAQIKAMQEKLDQSQEAKQASDEVVRALKDFIAVPSTQIEEIKLPPLPTEDIPDEEEQPKATSYWSLSSLIGSRKAESKAVPAKPVVEVRPAVAAASSSQLKPLSASIADTLVAASPALTAFSGWSRRRASTAAPQVQQPLSTPPVQPVLRKKQCNSAFADANSFDTFSFQSVSRHPALVDSPPSPGGTTSTFTSPMHAPSRAF